MQCIGIFCSGLSEINLFNNAALYNAESTPSNTAQASVAKEMRIILLILLDYQLIKLNFSFGLTKKIGYALWLPPSRRLPNAAST